MGKSTVYETPTFRYMQNVLALCQSYASLRKEGWREVGEVLREVIVHRTLVGFYFFVTHVITKTTRQTRDEFSVFLNKT